MLPRFTKAPRSISSSLLPWSFGVSTWLLRKNVDFAMRLVESSAVYSRYHFGTAYKIARKSSRKGGSGY